MKRDVVLAHARQTLATVRSAYPAAWTMPVESSARWSPEQAMAWWDQAGWPVGANFTPSSAGNQLEVFQDDTYDPEGIDRELGWAADLGFTSIRLFLHHLLHDAPGFGDRLDEVLSIAAGHSIKPLLVLFDGCWDPHPRPGPQRSPRPGVHNSMWLQSPGADLLADPRRWDRELRPYVERTIGRFADDPRVLGWDLFNEPNNPNLGSYAASEWREKDRAATLLLERTFDWAQAVDPSQPLTAGVFVGTTGATELADPINRVMLSRSDVISFHCYTGRAKLERAITHLAAYGRPLLCTEWMGRPDSPPELIDVFAKHDVGAYTWGLVDGRTQTRYSWRSWQRPQGTDAPWFHELLHRDGTPYDESEAAAIRDVCRPRRQAATVERAER